MEGVSNPDVGGRPPALTPEVRDLILQSLREGNYREVAAEWAGVGVTTFYRWMKRGKTEVNSIYWEFRKAVKEAERCAEMNMVELVTSAAKLDARHAQWYLERKFPERWASNRRELALLRKRLEELESDAKLREQTPQAGGTAAPPQSSAPAPPAGDRPVSDEPVVVDDRRGDDAGPVAGGTPPIA